MSNKQHTTSCINTKKLSPKSMMSYTWPQRFRLPDSLEQMSNDFELFMHCVGIYNEVAQNPCFPSKGQ